MLDHKTQHQQKHVTNCSDISLPLPTVGGHNNHIGPISQRNRGLHSHSELASIPTYTWSFVSFMMQNRAEITGSGGSFWEYTSQRWSYRDRWRGRNRTHTHPHSLGKRQSVRDKPTLAPCQQTSKDTQLMNTHTLSDMDILKELLTHTRVHTRARLFCV